MQFNLAGFFPKLDASEMRSGRRESSAWLNGTAPARAGARSGCATSAAPYVLPRSPFVGEHVDAEERVEAGPATPLGTSSLDTHSSARMEGLTVTVDSPGDRRRASSGLAKCPAVALLDDRSRLKRELSDSPSPRDRGGNGAKRARNPTAPQRAVGSARDELEALIDVGGDVEVANDVTGLVRVMGIDRERTTRSER